MTWLGRVRRAVTPTPLAAVLLGLILVGYVASEPVPPWPTEMSEERAIRIADRYDQVIRRIASERHQQQDSTQQSDRYGASDERISRYIAGDYSNQINELIAWWVYLAMTVLVSYLFLCMICAWPKTIAKTMRDRRFQSVAIVGSVGAFTVSATLFAERFWLSDVAAATVAFTVGSAVALAVLQWGFSRRGG